MEKEEEYKGEDQVHQTVGSDQKGRQIRRRRPRYFGGQNSTFLYSLFSRREMAFRLTQGLLIILFCIITPTVDQVYSLIRYVSHLFKKSRIVQASDLLMVWRLLSGPQPDMQILSGETFTFELFSFKTLLPALPFPFLHVVNGSLKSQSPQIQRMYHEVSIS